MNQIPKVSTREMPASEFAAYVSEIVTKAGNAVKALASLVAVGFTGTSEAPKVFVAYVEGLGQTLVQKLSVNVTVPPGYRGIAQVATNGRGVTCVEGHKGITDHPRFGQIVGILKEQILDAIENGATLMLTTPNDGSRNYGWLSADGQPWQKVAIKGAPSRSFRFIPGTPYAIACTGSKRIAIGSTDDIEGLTGKGKGWRKNSYEKNPLGKASIACLSRVDKDGTVTISGFDGSKQSFNVAKMTPERPNDFDAAGKQQIKTGAYEIGSLTLDEQLGVQAGIAEALRGRGPRAIAVDYLPATPASRGRSSEASPASA